jgi:hypothetical protein
LLEPAIVTVLLSPIAIRPVNSMSVPAKPGGAMKKSLALVAFPSGVTIEIRPDVPVGAAAVRLVPLAAVSRASVPLKLTLVFATAVSKFVPEIVTAVSAPPHTGVKPVIVGCFEAARVNVLELVPVPPGAVTLIVPVVAPAGTVTTSLLRLTELTVASIPLNLTTFSAGVEPNAVP